MKRLLAPIGVSLLVGLAGCGLKNTTVHPAAASVGHAHAIRTITYVNPLPNDPLWDRIGTCMQQAAAEHGISVKIVGPPGGNVDFQGLENLDSQAVADHADALVTWTAGAPAAFDAILARARQQSIPTVTLLSSDTTHNQTVDIGTPPAAFARLQIEAIARRPGPQRIGVISQTPYGAYVSTIRSTIAAHPNLHLEQVVFDGGTFTNDISLVSGMLVAHPDINVLVNYSGFTGVLTAIRELHRVGRVHALISSDFPKAAEQYIRDGLVAGVRVVPSCHIGQLALARLLTIAQGHRVPSHIDEGDRIVTGPEFEAITRRGGL